MSWVDTIYTLSKEMPVVSAAIWENTVSAPWPISVAPIQSCMDPSWFNIMRVEAVSREMGCTPVL